MGKLRVGSLMVGDLTSNGELDFSTRRDHMLPVCACRWGPLALCYQGDMENLQVVSDLNFGGDS